MGVGTGKTIQNYKRKDGWRMEVKLHAFLTSALDGSEWSD
jgi:hypothetical protein